MVRVSKYVVSSFSFALITGMGIELIKIDGDQKNFVCNFPCYFVSTCHPSRDILSSRFIRADGLDISGPYQTIRFIQHHIFITQDTMKILHLSIQTSIESFSP